MQTKKLLFIKEKNLAAFFSDLLKNYEIVAPVKKENIHVFEQIKRFSDADLNFINTTFPAKKYFIPDEEPLLVYKGNNVKVDFNKTKRIIFGMRPCDVHSLLHQEKIFLDGELNDPYYEKRRENTLIFALNCVESGENCFCTSLGTDSVTEGFDLLFSKVSQGYIVEVGSKKGENILAKEGEFFTETKGKEKQIKKVKCKKNLLEEDIEKLENAFHSKVWEKHAEKCLSCCSCTLTCPNCACFGMRDVVNLNLISGERIREWQSCQLKIFTKVAGEYVFRNERHKRLRHRIYHQLNYFKKEYGAHYCVGCGRCISNCPTKIDMTEIIKEL